MEWDITKRPNLGLDHTTNKYYLQEEITPKEEEKIGSLPITQKDESETEIPRAIEIDEPVGNYRINNFYASLFDTVESTAKPSKPIKNVKIKRIRAKKQVKSNDEDLNQENQKK